MHVHTHVHTPPFDTEAKPIRFPQFMTALPRICQPFVVARAGTLLSYNALSLNCRPSLRHGYRHGHGREYGWRPEQSQRWFSNQKNRSTLDEEANEAKKAYKMLEVPVGASSRDIRNAYFRLALKYHPDKCRNEQDMKIKAESAARFTKVSPSQLLIHLAYLTVDECYQLTHCQSRVTMHTNV